MFVKPRHEVLFLKRRLLPYSKETMGPAKDLKHSIIIQYVNKASK